MIFGKSHTQDITAKSHVKIFTANGLNIAGKFIDFTVILNQVILVKSG